MAILWIVVFFVALIALVKGADWFLGSAEKIGHALGFPPFIIGVLIIGIGTSLPEVISSVFAVVQGNPEIVVANAIGSNIANILLVVGVAAIIGKKLAVSQDLINLEIPLLASTTGLFLIVAADRIISFPEAVILILGSVVYFGYVLFGRNGDDQSNTKQSRKKKPHERVVTKDTIYLFVGAAGLVFGAKYLIDAVINLSEIWNIATGVIAITAVAIGTSLPELIVSIKAALKGKSEVALGNIFGSNVFNLLIVVGIPGLMARLTLDDPTFTLGLPFLAIVTLIFMISGISKRVYSWEGAFYLLIYLVFMAKLFTLF